LVAYDNFVRPGFGRSAIALDRLHETAQVAEREDVALHGVTVIACRRVGREQRGVVAAFGHLQIAEEQ
jgi:hypothetical protein